MAALAAGFWLQRFEYPFFHTVVEGSGLVVAVMIYAWATATDKFSGNTYLSFLGNAYLFVGILSTFHLFAYLSLHVSPQSSPEISAQIWIVLRFLASFSLLAAPSFLNRPLPRAWTLGLYGSFCLMSLTIILWLRVFPSYKTLEGGPSRFSLVSEALITGLMLWAMIRHIQHRSQMDSTLFQAMLSSMVLSVVSDISLSLHSDATGLLDYIGHVAATASNWMVYRGIVIRGMEAPYYQLLEAYENTIAGWAAALELRDFETEGHSQRVTDMAVHLSRSLGMDEKLIVHVRRGALLHDIGKIGVPDDILLKPGALTEEERTVMQRHTVYAYQLLSRIPFLKEAIDIPYCHHEKWDGTGYPRGLKGEEIPLAARVFSVVDVWDALRSDRPYRDAWSEDRTLAYIIEHAGRDFDPDVVRAFVNDPDCRVAATVKDIPVVGGRS